MAKLDMKLPSYEDSIFSTQEERDLQNAEHIVKIPIDQISDFEGHPFSVKLDEDMTRLIESIKNTGMNTPAIIRPKKDGNGYEMIAGHRRKFALTQLGATEMDVIVRDMNDDDATIQMVDTNIQREYIKPTERGYAYKMRLDAMKHQGKQVPDYEQDVGIEYSKSTSSQLETKLSRSDELLALQIGIDRNKIQRFIRLTYLIKPLQQMVDKEHPNELTMAFNPAVELSFLTLDEQKHLVDIIEEKMATPSLAQCQDFKKKSKQGKLTKEYMDEILGEEKPNQQENMVIQNKDSNKYYPRDITPRERKQHMFTLWERWKQSTEYEKDIKTIRKKKHEISR